MPLDSAALRHTLSPPELAQLETEGFLRVGPVLTADELAEARAHVDRVVDDVIRDGGNTRKEIGREVLDAYPVVPLELRAGECGLHLPWTIHGSGANRSDRRRAALPLRYISGATRLLPPDDTNLKPGAPAGRVDRPAPMRARGDALGLAQGVRRRRAPSPAVSPAGRLSRGEGDR